jgi:adenylate cyclase
MSATEIERKFRLLHTPPVELFPGGTAISQGYVFAEDWELRLRSSADRYYLTIKSDGTISRAEWESEIPRWVFDSLWPKTEGRRLQKTRYKIPHGPLYIELEIYAGSLSGLVTLECEFPDERAAAQFVLPSWAESAIDVTEDKAYKNKALALRGKPDG